MSAFHHYSLKTSLLAYIGLVPISLHTTAQNMSHRPAVDSVQSIRRTEGYRQGHRYHQQRRSYKGHHWICDGNSKKRYGAEKSPCRLNE